MAAKYGRAETPRNFFFYVDLMHAFLNLSPIHTAKKLHHLCRAANTLEFFWVCGACGKDTDVFDIFSPFAAN